MIFRALDENVSKNYLNLLRQLLSNLLRGIFWYVLKYPKRYAIIFLGEKDSLTGYDHRDLEVFVFEIFYSNV